MEEILAIMEEMGLLKNLKTDRITFCSEMFVKYDANDDGVLSFDEFKGFYNAAIDDARGRKRAPKPERKGTKSGMSDDTKNARKAIQQEKARKKAEEAERIRKENAEMKARLNAEKNKNDPPGKMDEDILRKRKEMAEERKRKKEIEASRLKAENRSMTKKLSNVAAVTDNDISDDLGGQVQAARDARAAKALDDQAAHKAELKARQKATNDMKANASARTDNDLLDDVDAEGNSVADARAKKAQEGEDKKAQRAQEASANAAELKRMKNETAARTDNDLLDDVMEDGTSLADARAAKAQEGEDKKAQRAQEADANAAALADMKLGTQARTDDGDGLSK